MSREHSGQRKFLPFNSHLLRSLIFVLFCFNMSVSSFCVSISSYQICEFLYEQKHLYDRIIACYLKDPLRKVNLRSFSALTSFIIRVSLSGPLCLKPESFCCSARRRFITTSITSCPCLDTAQRRSRLHGTNP